MLRKNLISAPKMDVKGVKFEGRKGKIEVTNKIGQPLFTTKLRDGIYYVFPKIPSNEINHIKFKDPKTSNNFKHSKQTKIEMAYMKNDNFKLWHKRFAYVSPKLIERTTKYE